MPKTLAGPRRRKIAAKQPFTNVMIAPDRSPRLAGQQIRARPSENPLRKGHYNNTVAPGLRVGRGLEHHGRQRGAPAHHELRPASGSGEDWNITMREFVEALN